MASSGARQAQIDRAVLDLAEAVMLTGEERKPFPAMVVEAGPRRVRIQLCEPPVRQ